MSSKNCFNCFNVQSGDKRALSKYNTVQKSAASLKIDNNKTIK